MSIKSWETEIVTVKVLGCCTCLQVDHHCRINMGGTGDYCSLCVAGQKEWRGAAVTAQRLARGEQQIAESADGSQSCVLALS